MRSISLKIIAPLLLVINLNNANAQRITGTEGYSKEIGVMVSMLNNLKGRIDNMTKNLSIEEVDYLMDEKANRIGALIMHLAAVEKDYQLFTFENRDLNRKELKEWGPGMELGKMGRKELQNHPIEYYMNKWNEVRAETLRFLKTKNDKWLYEDIEIEGEESNNYWCWFHVMEHQANHMGQIALILGRLPEK